MIKLFLIVFFMALFSFLAYLFSALTGSGAVAASVTGTLTVLGFGTKGFIVLVLFFVTSSLLSKFKKASKREAAAKTEKGDRRDWMQVFANGGIASLAGLMCYFTGHELWLFVFSTAIASTNADTWASEIGTLGRKPPLSLRTFTIVAPGTSGAVSIPGTMAGLSGSLLIAAAVYYLYDISIETALLIFLFGFAGNVIDSLLGASVQAVYRCDRCRSETEKLYHCGQKTTRIRGSS